MNNLFFRTNLAPYRIAIYNALHDKLNCDFYFYWKYDHSQEFNMEELLKTCKFKPNYLCGISLGKPSRKLCFQVWSIIKKHNPEIVIVPEFQLLTIQVIIYKFLFRKKFKIISMCDDSLDMVANKNDFTVVHRIARSLIVPFLDNILLINPKVVDWYRQHYNKGIWLPIIRDEKEEIGLYKASIPLSNEYNKKFNLTNKKVLIFVGRLVRVKNISNLLKAIKLTQQDFTTVIIGDGEDKVMLEQKTKEIQNKEIIFAGRFEGSELRAWYNIGDVFILPSHQESFGAVTNEALLAGNISLVSEKAGSECLIQEGINGYLIDPFDPFDIASKIDSAMKRIDKKCSVISLKPNLMNIKFEDRIDDVLIEINKSEL